MTRRFVSLGVGLTSVPVLARREGGPAPSRVGMTGDSIVSQNNLTTASATIKTQAHGELAQAHALWPYFEWDSWGTVTNNPPVGGGARNFFGMNTGFDGETSAMILARTPGNLALRPEVQIVSVGTNDITPITSGTTQPAIDAIVATAASNIAAICNLYLGRGAKVVLANIRPRAFSGDSANDKAAVLALNAALASYAAATPGVTLWDVYSVYDDGTNTPKAGWLNDGLHPSTIGAAAAGASLATVLQGLVTPLSGIQLPAVNLVTNPTLQGTGGVTTTGITGGQIGTGWTAQRPVTANAAAIASSHDGNGRQSFTISPTGAGLATETMTLVQVVPTTPGDWIRYGYDIDLSDWDGWREIKILTNQNTRVFDFALGSQIINTAGGKRLTLVSMPHKVPAGMTTFNLQLTPLYDGTKSTPGVLTVRNAWLGKVSDPAAAHGLSAIA